MSLRQPVPLLALAAVALAIWCALTHRWSIESWSTPLQLHGDPLEIYARVQAAKEDPAQPLLGYSSLPRLAAPLGASWSRYPVSDRLVFTGLGLLAKVVGVFAAVNLAIALVHALNAIAFYVCARFLRWHKAWAMALALLFSFSSYNFRWGVTVSLSLTFAIPPLLLLCGWIARSAPAVRARSWTGLAILLGIWFGGANPYLGFFAAQLAVGAALLQLVRRREKARWRAGVLFVAITGLSFLLHNAAYFLTPDVVGGRLTLSRNYAGSEIYGLKLTDLVVPPAEHPLVAFREFGRAYFAQSALRTEFFVNYLGLFGLLGLALLAWRGLRGLASKRGTRIPDAFLGMGWTLVFSSTGGVNSLLALGGLELFRASNRNSIFILVWALFFLGHWAHRRLRWRSSLIPWAVAVLVVALGVFDSIPRLRARRVLQQNARELSAQRHLVAKLEARLGPGAMIYQLPATIFPEAGIVASMGDYEHFRPYLLSDTLRFSYGALRGTSASRSLRALSRLPAAKLKEELEAAGFAAVWINRRGVPQRGETLIAEFKDLGLQEFVHRMDDDIMVFLLQPSPEPRPLDLANPALYEAWDVIRTLTQPEIVVLDGWYDLETHGSRSWRWARDAATAGLRMPTPGRVELRFRAYSLEPGQLVVTCRGREVHRRPIGPGTRDLRTIVLELPAGRHPLQWRFTGRVTHPPSPDSRELGFAIEDLEVAALSRTTDGGSKH